MSVVKIMPCLDMKDGRVVKGVKFVDLKDAGDPVANASFYDKEGADELAILDIAATIEVRKTRSKWVKEVIAVIKVPLTVGGGISSLEDMKQLFELGVSKVSVNTAAVKRPAMIREASERFGKERIVIAVDGWNNVKMSSGYEVVIRGGSTGTGIDAVDWAKTCETLGAGELLLTSVDRDGTQEGYDLEFTKAISEAVSIPIIASGGAGKLEHFYDGVIVGGATTLLAASLFHFRRITIREVKKYLNEKGLKVNLS
jgi:cyclase